MNVSRSGYYKWLKNKNILNQYELNRKQLGELILDVHKRKPSYGYHRIRKIILDETGWVVSDNLVHKVCKSLNIKSKAKHYKYKKPGEESIKFYNAIMVIGKQHDHLKKQFQTQQRYGLKENRMIGRFIQMFLIMRQLVMMLGNQCMVMVY